LSLLPQDREGYYADTPEMSQALFDVHAGLTRRALVENTEDVAFVVWSENEFADADDAFFMDQVKILAEEAGVYFVVRKNRGLFYEVQVKSVRDLNYTYCRKDKMPLCPERIVALALFEDGAELKPFLIPSFEWRKPNALLVDRDYKGGRNKPEWGINLSQKSLALLDTYVFSNVVVRLDG